MGAAGNESGVDGARQGLKPPEAVLAFYSPTRVMRISGGRPPSSFMALKVRERGMLCLKACTTHPSPTTTKSAPGNRSIIRA
jgi:hypothetical protein